MGNFKTEVAEGIPGRIPPMPVEAPNISHAPARTLLLNEKEKAQALSNALRYFPRSMHEELAGEFARELETDGRIYMRRFRPTYEMKARPVDEYPARCKQAASIMLMIQNNLNPDVAQHPYELITYGGNGAVFQNWAQYLLTMRYLAEMTDEQTLVMYSGHPMGLFPSHKDAPRVVVTNGMVIPNYSKPDDWERMNALGVSQYGQMTAGSYMYIGPQGIVHGTTITVLNAGRMLEGKAEDGLGGKLFVTFLVPAFPAAAFFFARFFAAAIRSPPCEFAVCRRKFTFPPLRGRGLSSLLSAVPHRRGDATSPLANSASVSIITERRGCQFASPAVRAGSGNSPPSGRDPPCLPPPRGERRARYTECSG